MRDGIVTQSSPKLGYTYMYYIVKFVLELKNKMRLQIALKITLKL